PKQYMEMAGRPVLAHTMKAFAEHPGVEKVRAVIHPNDMGLYQSSAQGLDVLDPVPGGPSRQQSVLLGLESLTEFDPAKVLIHDGARPLVSGAIIAHTISALDAAPGAIAAVPVRDTLKRQKHAASTIEETVDRSGLWRAQTPQGFRFDDILAAHRAAQGLDLTDDAAVAEHAGLSVALIEDREDNLKITTADDLARAARTMTAGDHVAVGSGFDVHKFGPGDRIRMCGVDIPHAHGLIGHSDADAGLHALTDALLATVGGGDIGVHFPPSDARWAGADSATFVQFALDQIQDRGGRISHVDLTIICEAPKIGPHRTEMIGRLSELLGLDENHINVKATTTEGLGFTGRGEGIAAQATATVMLAGGRP
ncbi:MAG: bifunctional 2-C-methyl-D-erythritol 4-phosphate cytidylyltransferase/2-C-methyl-D-erythritol 2,4-cyclodiphosphate synthase, partial [Alphaproteobacteria bacterium]|nr:bifunctional 2-C-methyl-D-erythritol 4-phosphate cytidylyltransferase/2-C-methyl-D-erythritol 2,4-cyclodiphosphate synthase [Alphaproteobacteria bacterium]